MNRRRKPRVGLRCGDDNEIEKDHSGGADERVAARRGEDRFCGMSDLGAGEGGKPEHLPFLPRRRRRALLVCQWSTSSRSTGRGEAKGAASARTERRKAGRHNGD